MASVTINLPLTIAQAVQVFTDVSDLPPTYILGGIAYVSDSQELYAYNGTNWILIAGGGGGGAVDSVNGQTGVVVLTTDDIAEGATNLYFTNGRAQSAVVVQTIINGDTTHATSSSVLFSALAAKVPTSRLINTTAPLTGGGDLTADRTFAIPQANSTTSGYLSAADWVIFDSTSGAAISSLTGDVSATGPGAAAATVNSIGGSSAANVHTAELLANAATNANTASTIVKRDGSGNFTAGTITASLTGHASLDLALAGGTMSGAIAMGANKITGLADPTAAQDAATKNYIDTNFVPDTAKGAANGVATLDSGGKVPVAQLPSTIMNYRGAWNAATNSPTLADGTGLNGDVWRASVAGTQNLGSGSQTWAVGDFAVYNGTIWQHSPAADGVSSVNGMTGAVVLTTDNITEGVTNLYFTNARAISAVVVQTITSGDTTHATSSGVLFTALAGKQATGNYITALTGDVTASGPGSAAATLASVGTAGTYVTVTTDAKGRVTSGVAGPQTIALGGTNSSTALNNNRNIVSSGGKIVESAAIAASRALVSDTNGLPTASATTSTELGFVSGVTSAIQTQLNAKQAVLTVVYKPLTLTPSGNVFSSWTSLYAVINAAPHGRKIIQIDGTDDTQVGQIQAIIPAGTWNMLNTQLDVVYGADGSLPSVTCADGCFLQNAVLFGNTIDITTSSATSNPPISFTDGNTYFIILGRAATLGGGPNSPLIKVSNGSSIFMLMDTGANIQDDGAGTIQLVTGGQAAIIFGADATSDADAFIDDGTGSVVAIIGVGSADFSASNAGFTGSIGMVLEDIAANHAYDGTFLPSQLSAANVQDAIDQVATGQDPAYVIVTATTGGSTTIPAATDGCFLNSTGTLLTYTVTLPASPANGQKVIISTNHAITTLTLSGGTVVGAPSGLALGSTLRLRYLSSLTQWWPS